jgi:hypothetical protein
MTDNAERKVREWAKGRNGDPLTPRDVVDLVFAQADDQESDHHESMMRLDDLETRLVNHFADAVVRDQRIQKLEATAEAGPELVKSYVQGYVDCEHRKRHGKHMEDFHSADATFQNRLVWFFASAAGKVTLVMLGLLAGLLLNLIVYGRP